MNTPSLSLYRTFLRYSLVLGFVLFSFSAKAEKTYSEEELKKIQQLVPDSPKLRNSIDQLKKRAKEKNPEARLLYAKALLSAKETEEAITVLRTFNVEEEPRALVLLAKAFELKNDPLEQARVLEILRKSHPFSEFVLIWLSEAYSNTRTTDKAVEILRSMIKRQPKRKAPYLKLFDIFEKTKNAYEIRTLLADMANIFSSDAEVISKLCQYYAQGGFLEQAADSCTKAITLNNSIPENHAYLAITRKNMKSPELADKIVKQGAKQFPKSELMQFTAGSFAEEEKNWESAYRYYKTCSKFHKDSDRCQRGLAVTAFELKRYKEALPAFTKSCQKDPQARNEFRNAITFLKNKQIVQYTEDYQRAFEQCGMKSE